MTKPFFSVIVAVLNGAQTLRRCLDSVLNQTARDFEIVVRDGASTDGTLGILRSYGASLASVESAEDTGIYAAWNSALRSARGDWICFLGADDRLAAPSVLELLAPTLRSAFPMYRVVYGRLVVENRYGEMLYDLGEPWGHIRRAFPQVMCLPHIGLMYHRTVFAERGRFDENFKVAGDYDMLLREVRHREPLFVPGPPIAVMTAGGISMQPSNIGRSLAEVRRAQRKQGHRMPGPLWLAAYSRHLVRSGLWNVLGERYTPTVLDACRYLLGKPRHWTKL